MPGPGLFSLRDHTSSCFLWNLMCLPSSWVHKGNRSTSTLCQPHQRQPQESCLPSNRWALSMEGTLQKEHDSRCATLDRYVQLNYFQNLASCWHIQLGALCRITRPYAPSTSPPNIFSKPTSSQALFWRWRKGKSEADLGKTGALGQGECVFTWWCTHGDAHACLFLLGSPCFLSSSIAGKKNCYSVTIEPKDEALISSDCWDTVWVFWCHYCTDSRVQWRGAEILR